jgi:ketosteroid isomerase-like protein
LSGTDKGYAQDYATCFVVENGKIKRIREYFNAIASARAILPGGLAGVPAEH